MIEFTETDSFKNMVKELYNCEPGKRKDFVKEVILNKSELKKGGIITPDSISLERSFFFDNRPTLFCVVKYLKDKKRKVTVTYDEQFGEITKQ